MSREEFMERLAFLLSDISEEEREDALLYYEDYFAEAGEEKESEIIRELGSPERVAAMIRSSSSMEDGGSFTERGFEDERFRDPNYQLAKRLDLPELVEESSQGTKKDSTDDNYYDEETIRRDQDSKKQPWTSKPLKGILWIILFCMIFDLFEGIFAFVTGIFAVFAGVILFPGGGVLASGITAIVLFILTAINLWNPTHAVFFGGLALVSIGVMFLFLVLSVQVYAKWIPKLLKKLWVLGQSLVKKITGDTIENH